MEKEVAVALITASATVLVALIGWGSGSFRWIGRQVEKWLDERRELRRNMPATPKKTLHVVPDSCHGDFFGPTWSNHEYPGGETATECGAFLLITNLYSALVKPTWTMVRLRGWSLPRRKVYDVRLNQMEDKLRGVVPGKSTTQWHIAFNVFPHVPKGATVRADITIFDHFGNPHMARNMRFVDTPSHEPPYYRKRAESLDSAKSVESGTP